MPAHIWRTGEPKPWSAPPAGLGRRSAGSVGHLASHHAPAPQSLGAGRPARRTHRAGGTCQPVHSACGTFQGQVYLRAQADTADLSALLAAWPQGRRNASASGKLMGRAGVALETGGRFASTRMMGHAGCQWSGVQRRWGTDFPVDCRREGRQGSIRSGREAQGGPGRVRRRIMGETPQPKSNPAGLRGLTSTGSRRSGGQSRFRCGSQHGVPGGRSLHGQLAFAASSLQSQGWVTVSQTASELMTLFSGER